MNRMTFFQLRRHAIFLPLLLCLFNATILDAQERKYQRKSITSLGTVLVKPGLSPKTDMINNRLKYYIEVPRFDYNVLSAASTSDFVAKANQTDFSPASIGQALNQTVVARILQQVDAVAAERAKGNLKEEDLARAAVDKLKLTGVTTDDVNKVLNSAYVYLPVVTKYEETKSGDNVSVAMEGYILWYQIAVRNGKGEAVLLSQSSLPQSGGATATISESYSLKNRKVGGEDYARIISADTWAKNLSVAMKRTADFKLSGEITNLDGMYATVSIGKKEGVQLDDGYEAVDFFDDGKGGSVSKPVGFFRATTVRDNRTSASERSQFQGLILNGVERGAILTEHPSLGLDLYIRPKYFNYSSLTTLGVFREKITSAYGAELAIAYNLAKLTGVSQLFAEINFAGAFTSAPALAVGIPSNTTLLPIFGSVYLGPVKKFWFSRVGFHIGVMGGLDALILTNTTSNIPDGNLESVTIPAFGIRADAGLEFMISPDIIFAVNAGYKYGITPDEITIKLKNRDERKFKTADDPDFRNFAFTGFNLGIGLSFSLPSTGVDPFAALTSGQIDY
jgi:hypothetical protein